MRYTQATASRHCAESDGAKNKKGAQGAPSCKAGPEALASHLAWLRHKPLGNARSHPVSRSAEPRYSSLKVESSGGSSAIQLGRPSSHRKLRLLHQSKLAKSRQHPKCRAPHPVRAQPPNPIGCRRASSGKCMSGESPALRTAALPLRTYSSPAPPCSRGGCRHRPPYGSAPGSPRGPAPV